MKMVDPEAVLDLKYDKLAVNGREYVWSDPMQAVVDTTDNMVRIRQSLARPPDWC